MPSLTSTHRHPTVAVGGLGGSGTRVVAEILHHAGVSIGNDLNRSLDDMLFTFIFRRHETAKTSAQQITELAELYTTLRTSGAGSLSERENELLEQLISEPAFQFAPGWNRKRRQKIVEQKLSAVWGWKEPNTHVFVESLFELYPAIRYVHVVRNGLDMAYSDNQNQLELWGEKYLQTKTTPTPFWALKYWCAVQKKTLELQVKNPQSVYLLSFEKLCLDPLGETRKLLTFLGLQGSDELAEFTSTIRPPESAGRHQSENLNALDSNDVAFARSFEIW